MMRLYWPHQGFYMPNELAQKGLWEHIGNNIPFAAAILHSCGFDTRYSPQPVIHMNEQDSKIREQSR